MALVAMAFGLASIIKAVFFSFLEMCVFVHVLLIVISQKGEMFQQHSLEMVATIQ